MSPDTCLDAIKNALNGFSKNKISDPVNHIYIAGEIIGNAFKQMSTRELLAKSLSYSLAGATMPPEKKPLEALDDLCLEHGLAVVSYDTDKDAAVIMRRTLYKPYSMLMPRRFVITKKKEDSHAE